MHARTALSLALMLMLSTGCRVSAERQEGPEDEAAEMADAAETRGGVIELPADLLARAAVSVEAATATALARVPGGEVVAGELEEEGGALIYSFDLRSAGGDGIEEVHVDARTGAVVSQEHESAAEEAAEAEDEGGR